MCGDAALTLRCNSGSQPGNKLNFIPARGLHPSPPKQSCEDGVRGVRRFVFELLAAPVQTQHCFGGGGVGPVKNEVKFVAR